MNPPPIPAPDSKPLASGADLPRVSAFAKYGRMVLLIFLWFGVALFGSTAVAALFVAYAITTGFPTQEKPATLLLIAASNGLATVFCLVCIRLLRKNRAPVR